MFKNYLKIAYRNLIRHKAFSLINIMGLAVGMACFILILMWIQNELSFDRFHKNANRIYRVNRLFYNGDGTVNLHLRQVAPTIGPLLKNDFPEIDYSIRAIKMNQVIRYGNKCFEETHFIYTDPDIFNVFTIKMIKGNPKTALKGPFKIVISEEMAQKYFGKEEPMGKTLNFISAGKKGNFIVTGVIESLPQNSDLPADFLASFETLKSIVGEKELRDWSSNNYGTYLLLPEGYNIKRLENRLKNFINRHLGKGSSKWTQLRLQRFIDVHLEANYEGLYTLFALALFILLIACINFMNLATARSAGRAREVGVRKIVGAKRGQLIRQLLSESTFMSILALVVAVILVELTLPGFNKLFYCKLSFNIFNNMFLLVILLAIAVFVGLVSGSYPAFFLSAFSPVYILKGSFKKTGRKFSLRTVLVVFQFAISIFLICCVIVINQQRDYIRNRELGFEKEHMVVLPAGKSILNRLESVKQQLLQHNNILSVSAGKRFPPGKLADSWGARILRGETSEPITFRIALLMVDFDYIPTFRMKMAAGRNFLKTRPTDSSQAFILNETAVKKIGWKSPQEAIDKRFGYGTRNGRIIGVVRDFHFEPLHKEIAPLVMLFSPSSLENIAVRIDSNNIPGTLDFLKRKWQEFRPDYPFKYHFLDERFDRTYIMEKIISKIFSYAAFLAVLIACLGLFGLSAYTVEKRTKEIGIRKVLGASISGVVFLLTGKYTKWVVVSNVIAWPIAYLFINWFLRNYAYRINIGTWIFLLAGTITLVIALLTVSYQSIKAALANPVEALRYE